MTSGPPPPVPPDDDGPRRFSAALDAADDARFTRVTTAVGQRTGRIAGRRQDPRGGRYPSRADVLRAALALVDDDPQLMERLAAEVTRQVTGRRTG